MARKGLLSGAALKKIAGGVATGAGLALRDERRAELNQAKADKDRAFTAAENQKRMDANAEQGRLSREASANENEKNRTTKSESSKLLAATAESRDVRRNNLLIKKSDADAKFKIESLKYQQENTRADKEWRILKTRGDQKRDSATDAWRKQEAAARNARDEATEEHRDLVLAGMQDDKRYTAEFRKEVQSAKRASEAAAAEYRKLVLGDKIKDREQKGEIAETNAAVKIATGSIGNYNPRGVSAEDMGRRVMSAKGLLRGEKPPRSVPPQAAIDLLRKNPDVAPQFIKKYGAEAYDVATGSN